MQPIDRKRAAEKRRLRQTKESLVHMDFCSRVKCGGEGAQRLRELAERLVGDLSRVEPWAREANKQGRAALYGKAALHELKRILEPVGFTLTELCESDPTRVAKVLNDKECREVFHLNTVLAIIINAGLPLSVLPEPQSGSMALVSGLCRATVRIRQLMEVSNDG